MGYSFICSFILLGRICLLILVGTMDISRLLLHLQGVVSTSQMFNLLEMHQFIWACQNNCNQSIINNITNPVQSWTFQKHTTMLLIHRGSTHQSQLNIQATGHQQGTTRGSDPAIMHWLLTYLQQQQSVVIFNSSFAQPHGPFDSYL